MTTAIMLTHGTGGDVLPFVAIGQELRRRGHEVVLLSHHPYATLAEAAGLTFVAVDTEAAYRRHLAQTPDLLHASGPAAIRAFYQRGGLVEQTGREVDALLAGERGGQTVLIGRHTSALAVLIAAEVLGVPSAWVAVSPTQLLTAKAALLNLRNGLAPELDGLRARVGLPPIAAWEPWFNSTDMVLGLWPRWFDDAGVRAPDHVRLTGFASSDGGPVVNPEVPAAAAAMLAAAEPPILITAGTGRMTHERFYQVAIDAVARIDRAALVVTPHRSLLPDRLPDRIRWWASLPFAAVMPQVGAVIHHGGIGTAATATAAGAPQVILAHGADRPDNAERLAACGLATWLPVEECATDLVTGMLRSALAGPTGRSRAGAPAIVRVEDGTLAAAVAVERLFAGPSSAGSRRVQARLRALPAAQRQVVLAQLRARATSAGT